MLIKNKYLGFAIEHSYLLAKFKIRLFNYVNAASSIKLTIRDIFEDFCTVCCSSVLIKQNVIFLQLVILIYKSL